MIRVFEKLQGLGYRGGYDAVRRYAAGWHRARSAMTAAAYVPQDIIDFNPAFKCCMADISQVNEFPDASTSLPHDFAEAIGYLK